MLKLVESSLSTDVTLPLIWSQTPVASMTTQKIDTATTATIIIATEIAKAMRVTDHGSMCVSRRLARRSFLDVGSGDSSSVASAFVLVWPSTGWSTLSLTAGITAVVAGEGLVVRA